MNYCYCVIQSHQGMHHVTVVFQDGKWRQQIVHEELDMNKEFIEMPAPPSEVSEWLNGLLK
jgi:hypothetical protein